ncbi:MAG: hypothetical protein L0220_02170, partial [Acidobacteria bacterium]|nr:hypothetical protein [Acidobacteriota bacterium]
GITLCPVLSIGTQAQTALNESIESLVASEQKTQISSGIVNFNYALEDQMQEYQYSSLATDDPNKLKGEKLEEEATDELKQPLPDNSMDQDPATLGIAPSGFNWKGAIQQSLIFIGVMHAYRMGTEAGTRAELKGAFFPDYIGSIKGLRGWRDGDPTYVNYVGHPFQGAVSGFIQIQNDPKGRKQEFDLKSRSYWKSRLKAFGWSAAVSTQFELGPLSEASLGNVGLKPNKKSPHPMGYVDLVVTPVMGTAWLVGEDLLDRYVISQIESKIGRRLVIIALRGLFNPTRSFANLYRGKWFWHRDYRP